MRREISLDARVADKPQPVQWAETRGQQVVTSRREMRNLGLQLPLRLRAIVCAQILARTHQPRQIAGFGRVGHVEIQGHDRRTLHHRRYSADQDEVNRVMDEGTQKMRERRVGRKSGPPLQRGMML